MATSNSKYAIVHSQYVPINSVLVWDTTLDSYLKSSSIFKKE